MYKYRHKVGSKYACQKCQIPILPAHITVVGRDAILGSGTDVCATYMAEKGIRFK